jgi:hypothetical protein
MTGYVWYSFGSDTTGPVLAEALGFEHGKKTPRLADVDVVVGWGCKRGKKYVYEDFAARVKAGQLRLLNTVEAVDRNRDKHASLAALHAGSVSVPGFRSLVGASGFKNRLGAAKDALSKGDVAFPLTVHTTTHNGHPQFCYTVEDLATAVANKETAHYIRSFCPGTEFRIHVFRDTALFAQMKDLTGEPIEACTRHLQSKLAKEIKRGNQPKGTVLPEPQAMEWVVKTLAAEMLDGPNHLQRSVTRGWELVDVSLDNVPELAVLEAIRAVEVLGLDLGAVSVTVESKEVARVTNVTTAPALNEAQMVHYVEAIQEFCGAAEEKPRKKAAASKAKPGRELIATLTRKVRGLDKERAEEVLRQLEGK